MSQTYIKFEYGYEWQTFIYSLVLFLRVSKCSIIVSCQSFIQLVEFLKPSSTRQNIILGCMDLLTRIKQRWWTFDPIPWRSDFAWLHNLMLVLMVHSTLILAIVSCKWARARSLGVDEPSNTLTLSKQLSSSMAISPQGQRCWPHQLNLDCNPHHWTHHHPIVRMLSKQTCISNHHNEFHNTCHNTQWYSLL